MTPEGAKMFALIWWVRKEFENEIEGQWVLPKVAGLSESGGPARKLMVGPESELPNRKVRGLKPTL